MNSFTPLVSEGLAIWGDKFAYEPFNLPAFLSLCWSTQGLLLWNLTFANLWWELPVTKQFSDLADGKFGAIVGKWLKDWSWWFALAGATLRMWNVGVTGGFIHSISAIISLFFVLPVINGKEPIPEFEQLLSGDEDLKLSLKLQALFHYVGYKKEYTFGAFALQVFLDSLLAMVSFTGFIFVPVQWIV